MNSALGPWATAEPLESLRRTGVKADNVVGWQHPDGDKSSGVRRMSPTALWGGGGLLEVRLRGRGGGMERQ